nr:hypothetical protein [Tanacetum cinerariifolium]
MGKEMIHEFGYEIPHVKIDRGFTSVVSSCPLLSVIRLCDCKLITNKGLKFLTKFCKSVKQVDLSGCYNITDTGIGYLNQNSRELIAIRISDCYNILDVGFRGSSRSLVSVEAERRMLDSNGVAAILCGGGLEYQTLPFMAHELRAIGLGGNGANIKILDIGGSVVDNDAIMNIAKGCPLLQEWNLSRCKEIHFSGWKSIGLYCQNLKTIHVNEMFNFFDDKMMALSNCRRLSVIYMCLGWYNLKRSPREICDMTRKDMKIIEYRNLK